MGQASKSPRQKNGSDRIICSDQRVRSLMIPPGIPDFFSPSRYLEGIESVELKGRAWAGHKQISLVEVSTDAGQTWEKGHLGKHVGRFAWAGWTYEWKNVSAGKYTLMVRAYDSDGNIQTHDNSAYEYYDMDITKSQCVDIVVVSLGTLKHGHRIDVPVTYPTL